MIVLGLSGLPHAQEHLLHTHPDLSPLDQRICQRLDSAAALVVDGRPVAAASEERFTGEGGGLAPVTGPFDHYLGARYIEGYVVGRVVGRVVDRVVDRVVEGTGVAASA